MPFSEIGGQIMHLPPSNSAPRKDKKKTLENRTPFKNEVKMYFFVILIILLHFGLKTTSTEA